MNRWFNQLLRIPMRFISPIMGKMMLLRRFLNPFALITLGVAWLGRLFKKIFKFRPDNMADYYRIGNLYVFKNFVLLLILGVALVPFIYFRFFAAPAIRGVSKNPEKPKTFVHYDADLAKYSGAAKILATNKQVAYIGAVATGKAKGAGKLYDAEGRLMYAGNFDANLYNGDGVEYYSDTARVKYVGQFANNQYDGYGKLYFPDGKTIQYEGDFVDGRWEGQGTLYNNSGQKLYEGAFLNNLFHGAGKQYLPNNARLLYEGDFQYGLKHGMGKLYNDVGTLTFEGRFAKDTRDVTAFLSETEAAVKAAYKTPFTDLNYFLSAERCVNFEQFPEVYLLNDAGRISKVVVIQNALPADLGDPVYEGETYAFAEDMAALNQLGLRNDFYKTSPTTQYTESVYRPEILKTKSYAREGHILTAFFTEKNELVYYVMQA